MAKSHTKIYIHYIWATKNRQRILIKNIREKVKEHIIKRKPFRKNWKNSIEGMALIRKKLIGSIMEGHQWPGLGLAALFLPRRERRG